MEDEQKTIQEDPQSNDENKGLEENELNLHYVNVEEEKEQSLVLPLISLILAVLSFLFYPFQLLAILLSVITVYVTRNHAMTYKPLTIIALILSVTGFVIGIGGVDLFDSLQPVFKEMSEGVSCDNLAIVSTTACYDLSNQKITLVITPNKDIYQLTLVIKTEDKKFVSKLKEPFYESVTSTIGLPFDVEQNGIPLIVEYKPVLKSYLRHEFIPCENETISVSLESCS